MPSSPYIPAPGTPIADEGANSLRQVIGDLAASAMGSPLVDVQGAGAMAGPGGLQLSLDVPPQIELFEVTQRWSSDVSQMDHKDYMPTKCAWTKAKKVFFCTDRSWTKLDDTTDDVFETIWHNSGYQIDSIDPNRAMPAYMQDAAHKSFMPAVGVGQWCWCLFEEESGVWIVLQPFEDIIRVKLTADWYACKSSTGRIQIASADANDPATAFDSGYELTVYDPLGVIKNDFLALTSSSSGGVPEWYIPAGSYAYVKRFADNNAWEPLRFMPGCGGSSSSSSSSSSGSSSSSSGSSSSSSGVSGGRCWIGTNAGLVAHKRPHTTTEDYADCSLVHVGLPGCGMAVDDAGHVLGWWSWSNVWFSPWGIAEPPQT